MIVTKAAKVGRKVASRGLKAADRKHAAKTVRVSTRTARGRRA